MNKQIDVAVCPTCHGTGMIGTIDWLTSGIDKEKLAKEREEALAEYEAQKKRDVAREIFAEIDKICHDYNRYEIGERGLFAKLAKLRKKYESEGADDE